MTQELAAYGYLIAAICFIMALRGLSSPVTSRQGNLFGVVGMVVAIGVTIATPGVVSPWLIIGGVVVGGAIGTVVALRIHMTALPQLVAAFHSLVGLAAVFVAAAAFVSPEAFGIGAPGQIKTQSLIEMGLGTIIGAITAPMPPPTAMPPIIIAQVRGSSGTATASVVRTAMAMPAMPR